MPVSVPGGINGKARRCPARLVAGWQLFGKAMAGQCPFYSVRVLVSAWATRMFKLFYAVKTVFWR